MFRCAQDSSCRHRLPSRGGQFFPEVQELPFKFFSPRQTDEECDERLIMGGSVTLLHAPPHGLPTLSLGCGPQIRGLGLPEDRAESVGNERMEVTVES